VRREKRRIHGISSLNGLVGRNDSMGSELLRLGTGRPLPPSAPSPASQGKEKRV